MKLNESGSMFLSREELAQLVGSTRKNVQSSWLTRRGIPFISDIQDRPVVLRNAVATLLALSSINSFVSVPLRSTAAQTTGQAAHPAKPNFHLIGA